MQSAISNIPEELISAIQKDDCIAFVGAGLSKACGYKDWKELTIELGKAICKDTTEVPPENWPAIAQEAQERAEHDYYRILENEYSYDVMKDNYHEMHVEVLKIPFAAYFTTNFDNCLEEAANRTGINVKVHNYPILDISKLKENKARMLAHIHGRVRDENGTLQVRNTVLTSSEYEKAYEPSGSLLFSFLQQSLTTYTMLFLGFNLLREPHIKKLFDIRKKILLELSKSLSNPSIIEKKHFILLPERWLEDARTDKKERDTKKEQHEQDECKMFGVDIIRYNTYGGKTHNVLTNLLRNIREQLEPDLNKSAVTYSHSLLEG